MAAANPKSLHIAMYPWFAFGHLTPFLHLANKLAKKGHIISFLLPPNAQGKLEQFNLYPVRITFIPINVPQVKGLPPGAETTADVPFPLHTHVMTAMDRTEVDIEALLLDLKPNIVLFDFTHWMPRLARRLGIKSIHYCIISPSTIGYSLSPARQLSGDNLTEADLRQPPRGFPGSSITLHAHEARAFVERRALIFGGVRFCDRQYVGLSECDALAFRTCREIEGTYVKYLEAEFGKPIMLSGPVIPEPTTPSLDERWAKWLGGFRAGEVIYCAFGSENTLQKDQFQELLLGLEITGKPFLAVLKPPMGVDSIEAALPDGYRERVEGRGTVHGGWVQQQLILEHPSVGCFITHCGSGSLAEALLNVCQLVLLPHVGDQIINARIMSRELKVGVEVDKGENEGLFTKDTVYKAVMAAMDDNSEIGREIRENHAKVRGLLLGEDLEESYINNFNKQLQELVE